MELKKVALHDVHVGLGAKMVPFAGFQMPVRYSSDLDEHHTVRQAVGIFDVSHMGEFLVQGPGALDLIQRVTSNDAAKLTDGKVQYSCLPNEDGGIVDDLLVYRLGQEDYMLVVNASNIEKDWNWINRFNTGGVRLKDISDETALFAVQGPKAMLTLQALTDLNLADMAYYTFAKGEFADVPDVIVSATGYTGAGGFEIYVPNAQARAVWDKIMAAGQPHGIKPIGLGARDTLRLEAGMLLYGQDLDETVSPLESGLEATVDLSQFRDFTGRAELTRRPVTRNLRGLKLEARGVPRAGCRVLTAHGAGQVTSGTFSPTLNQPIALARVPKAVAAGEEVEIEIRDKMLPARVVKYPFVRNGRALV